MSREAKILFVVLVIAVFLFGGISYIVLGTFLIYFFLYKFFLSKGKALLQTGVNAYTIRQKDRVKVFYHLKIDFHIPFVFSISVKNPYYFVLVKGEKEFRLFTSRADTFKNTEYIGNRRGVYDIGILDITVSDPLGFLRRKIELVDKKTVYVFPYLVPFERLNIYLSEPINGIKARYQLNADYTSIAGVRDYVPNDPFSIIHWKQTAHRDKLTVKELDFTASKRIQIIVDYYKKNLQFQDSASALAASIASYAIYHHLPVGLITNGMPENDISIGKGEFHLMRIFKALALAGPEKAEDTKNFLKKISLLIDFGSEIFFIEKDITEEFMLSILKLKPFTSRINIILLPDNTFVLPHEKPPHYYFKEAYYLTVLGHSKEALAKEGIFIYPILGKDYANKLEMVRR